MRELSNDLRFAVRTFGRRPILTLATIATLGLGIGATTAVFSLFDTVLLEPLPYADQERLLVVRENVPGITPMLPITVLEYVRLRQTSETLDDLALADRLGFNLVADGEPERVPGALVSANFFSLLGVTPAHGRGFEAGEARPGANGVAILGHGLWQQRFGGDADILGETLRFNLSPTYGPERDVPAVATVVGILPERFRSPFEDEQIWLPMAIDEAAADGSGHFYFGLGRLAADATLEQAQTELDTVVRAIAPEHNLHQREGRGMTLVPLAELQVRNIRGGLTTLLIAVGVVLLIAVVNVTNLLIVWSLDRQREVALRATLGAAGGRLVRQFLTESALLTAAGAAAGLILAWVALRFLAANGPPNIPRLAEIGLDPGALGFAVLVTVLAGLLAGLAPALRATQTLPMEVTREGGGRVAGSEGWTGRLRSVLVTVEIALALVVLIGAALLVRSFQTLQEVDYGFGVERLLTLETPLPGSKYAESHQREAFFRQALERVRAIPGVESAALVNTPPLSRHNTASTVEVVNRGEEGEALSGNFRQVSPGYFATMGIPLRRGRVLEPLDVAETPRVAVINETAARRFFPEEEPLDRQLELGVLSEPVRIVGVVGDVLHRRLDDQAQPTVYLASLGASSMTFMVRTATDPSSHVPALRRAIEEVDPEQPIDALATMQTIISESVSRPRFSAQMLGFLALSALLLAMVGIYGVLHHTVSQRTRETGIRLALGARRGTVLLWVLRRAALLIGAGVVLGVAGAIAATRLLASQLYGVSPTDLPTMVHTTAVLVVVALLAAFLPALRATRVDPVQALRYE